MIRFIINFILFGLLFYALWLFFPEAFSTLTSWAAALFNWLQDVFHQLSGRIRTDTTHPTTTAPALMMAWELFRK